MTPLHAKSASCYSANYESTRRSMRKPSSSGWGGKLILATVVLTIVEGALRKWVFSESPSLRYAAYFSKDVLFVFAGLAGAASMGVNNRRYAGLVLLASVGLILPSSLATFGNGSLVGAILSFRAYVVLPLCAFLAAATIRSDRSVAQMAILIGVFAIGEVALGSIQFRYPHTHWLNRYDLEAARVASESGHARATGTFSYIGGMNTMTIAAAWAGTYLFMSRTRVISRAFGITVIFSGIICALLAMSRGGMVLWLITVAGGVLCFRRVRELFLITTLALAGLGYFFFAGAPEEHQEAGVYDVAMKRFQNADTFTHRTSYFFDDLFIAFTEYPIGVGLGVGQPGGYVSESTKEARLGIQPLENEPARIIQEVGILGLAGVFIIRLLPFAVIVPRWKKCTNRKRLALYAAWIPFLLVVAISNLAFNHTFSSLYWCLVAVICGAAELSETDRENNWNAAIGLRKV
jgi:hypothetical protein